MRFGRLGPIGDEIPVLFDGDAIRDLRGVVGARGVDAATVERVRPAAARAGLPLLEGADGLRTGSPIARPGAIYCIGMNYAAHAAESGSEPPTSPVLFLKPPNTVVGPHDPVAIPRGSTRTDWEVELGVVIGRTALYLDSPDQALDHVLGYVAADDLSERDFQLVQSGGQWSKGKSAPGFTPLGPWLVTGDEVDPRDLRLTSRVNGEPRQDSSTRDLIFDVPYVIWHLSQYLRLDPGDLILTGTPEGVALSGRFPYLTDGDVVEVEIDGLGRQRTPFTAEMRR
ncbi:fumarylacetoacetate hydrolase family protein [Pseudolysinimonas sp.]|uniref:fumarylacetoacetate hydrolase family protein n=1 Tax=Pseudolysinimonas sp. TaxID=2680009 RepID=UPI003F811111